ncbi:MAG: caspase family protein, partial [Alphaproteobacteria bacterium]|nr:caspase family protein [Alphaproteobacteria bacterium]
MTFRHRKGLAATVVLLLAAAGAGLANQVAPAEAQGIQLPTLRVQTDRITRGIQTNIRLARNARLVIKPGEAIAVHSLALSSPRFLVTGLGNGSVRIWDLEFGREAAKIQAHDGTIADLAIGARDTFLATGGEDGRARVWQLSNGREIASFDAHPGGVAGVALDEAGQHLITAGADGRIGIWDIAAKSRRADLSGHVGAVTSMARSNDGNTLVTGGADGSVRTWDIANARALQTYTGHDSAVGAIALDETGNLIVSTDADGDIIVRDRRDGGQRQSFRGSSTPLTVAVNARRNFVGVGSEDAVVRLYDLSTGEETRAFRGHGGAVRHLAFEPTNQFLHTASVDGTSRVWDLPTGEQLAQVISTNSGWVVADSTGAYDGSPGGINSVQWQTSEGSFELDQRIQQDYQPGVLSRLVDEGADAVRGRDDLSEGFPVPPNVEISDNGTTTLDGRPAIDLTVTAKNDDSGGVSELRLYHNGKIVGPETAGVELVDRETEPAKHEMRLKVPLIAGRNVFQAIALNKAQVESRPATFTASQSEGGGSGTLHLVVVGIDTYRNPSLNLNYGVLDGRGVAEFFKDVRRGPFGQVRVHEIYNQAATREGIHRVFDLVRDTKPEDAVIVYLAGHGEAVDRDWFFLPHEVTDTSDEQQLRNAGFSSADLKDRALQIGARNVLVMIDTCKSGAALEAF